MYNLIYKFVHSKMVFCAYCLAYIGFLWTVLPAESLDHVEAGIIAEAECLREQLDGAEKEIARLTEEIEARNNWAHGLEAIIFELEAQGGCHEDQESEARRRMVYPEGLERISGDSWMGR